jgi:hypothetical protein
MVKVSDLVHGWSLWADPGNGDPWFKNENGYRLFYEVAASPHGPEVFRATKRVLDTMDLDWSKPGAELRYKATDRAKFALQSALMRLGRYDKDMLRTGIPVGAYANG